MSARPKLAARCHACNETATRQAWKPGGQDGLWMTEPGSVYVCDNDAHMPPGSQFDGQPDLVTVLTTLVGGIVQRLVRQR
jgi:hypothetical protein